MGCFGLFVLFGEFPCEVLVFGASISYSAMDLNESLGWSRVPQHKYHPGGAFFVPSLMASSK